MIFANNLQYLRRKEGITQEDFAEKLDVSRQTVSKWEQGVCYPEMDKLLSMCDMFAVSLDELLRKDLTGDYCKTTTEALEDSYERPIVIADGEQLKAHDRQYHVFGLRIAFATVLIMLGVVILLVLSAFHYKTYGEADVASAYVIVGVVTLLAFVGGAMPFYIIGGMTNENYLKQVGNVYFVYDKETVERFNRKFMAIVATAVSIIFVGVIQLILVAILLGDKGDGGEFYVILSTALLIAMVAVSVWMFIYYGIQHDKYQKANIGEAMKYEKIKEEKYGFISGIIMMIATAVFFIWGFAGGWNLSWISFVVGGIMCGVANTIIEAVIKNKK